MNRKVEENVRAVEVGASHTIFFKKKIESFVLQWFFSLFFCRLREREREARQGPMEKLFFFWPAKEETRSEQDNTHQKKKVKKSF